MASGAELVDDDPRVVVGRQALGERPERVARAHDGGHAQVSCGIAVGARPGASGEEPPSAAPACAVTSTSPAARTATERRRRT